MSVSSTSAPDRPADSAASTHQDDTDTGATRGRALSRLASGLPMPPPFWRRWSAQARDRVLGWGGGITLMFIALALRLYHLGEPRTLQFDETYYAKHGWSLLNFGYVRDYVEDANDKIVGGQTSGIFKETPDMVVHPEVGKWLIAAGEKLFGMDAFGWRFAAAMVGSLMVLLMVRFVRRVSGSTFIGLLAGTILAFDGLHFVLSRLALLDIFVAFFILLGVHCIVADRQWFREKLGDTFETGNGWGRRIWFRPWLLAGGVAWGLAIGTKWTALYSLAAFGLLCWAWSAGARKSRGVRLAWLKSAVLDGIPAFVHLVLLGAVVYTATWTGWLMNAQTYEQYKSNNPYTQEAGRGQWPTATEPDAEGLGEVTQSLRSLWHYHQDLWQFHRYGLTDAEHTYASDPATWLFMARPVGVTADLDIERGDQGCDAAKGDTCLRQVLLLGNPVVWWGGCVAMLAALVLWVGARDWRFGVAVIGVASAWLPWVWEAMNNSRPVFSFYMITALPFMVLALALLAGRFLGTSTEPSTRRSVGVVAGGTFVVLVLLAFAWFWPIWTAELITRDEWLSRIWFNRWI